MRPMLAAFFAVWLTFPRANTTENLHSHLCLPGSYDVTITVMSSTGVVLAKHSFNFGVTIPTPEARSVIRAGLRPSILPLFLCVCLSSLENLLMGVQDPENRVNGAVAII